MNGEVVKNTDQGHGSKDIISGTIEFVGKRQTMDIPPLNRKSPNTGFISEYVVADM